MNLRTQKYRTLSEMWPQNGKHILAQYDETSVIVYQAYRHEIGNFAAANGYFGGEFSYSRMSWIKTNFLWMMYRSGWGTKPGQEVTLAIKIKRTFFDSLLATAVASSFNQTLDITHAEWERRLAMSEVRLQWDPDHDPSGKPQQRRAIQLGLRGEILKEYGRQAIMAIEDISRFVEEMRSVVANSSLLMIPEESVYPLNSEGVKHNLGIQ